MKRNIVSLFVFAGMLAAIPDFARADGTPIYDENTGDQLPCGCGDLAKARRRLEEQLVALDNVNKQYSKSQIEDSKIQGQIPLMSRTTYDFINNGIDFDVRHTFYNDPPTGLHDLVNEYRSSATVVPANTLLCTIIIDVGHAGACMIESLRRHERPHLQACRLSQQMPGNESRPAYPLSKTETEYLAIEKLAIEGEIRFLRGAIAEMTPIACPDVPPRPSITPSPLLKILPLKAVKAMVE